MYLLLNGIADLNVLLVFGKVGKDVRAFAGMYAHRTQDVRIARLDDFDIGNLPARAFEVAREEVHMDYAAQHLVRLKPARVAFALLVERAQARRTGKP